MLCLSLLTQSLQLFFYISVELVEQEFSINFEMNSAAGHRAPSIYETDGKKVYLTQLTEYFAEIGTPLWKRIRSVNHQKLLYYLMQLHLVQLFNYCKPLTAAHNYPTRMAVGHSLTMIKCKNAALLPAVWECSYLGLRFYFPNILTLCQIKLYSYTIFYREPPALKFTARIKLPSHLIQLTVTHSFIVSLSHKFTIFRYCSSFPLRQSAVDSQI